MSVQTLSPEASEEARLAATRKQVRMGRLLSLTLLALLAVMWLVLAFSTNSFWTYNNISNLLRQGSMIAILATSLMTQIEYKNTAFRFGLPSLLRCSWALASAPFTVSGSPNLACRPSS